MSEIKGKSEAYEMVALEAEAVSTELDEGKPSGSPAPIDNTAPPPSVYCTTIDDLEPGLTKNVIALCETPKMFLARMLADGEEVTATFDVKFPGEFIPLWKLVAMCVFSLGLYGFVLFFRWVRRCCYRWRCCVPSLVSFSFGKMAVTNKGRIICWEEKVVQEKPPQEGCPESCHGSWFLCYIDGFILRAICCPFKLCCRLDKLICNILWMPLKCCIVMCCRDACAPPVNFETSNVTRVYRTADVKQISQYFVSEASCIWCCLDYSCGIEVSFNQFNHGSDHLQVATRSWFHENHFGEDAPGAASSSSLGAYWNWARTVYDKVVAPGIEVIEGAFGGTSNLKVLKIISNSGDRVHNGDVDSVLRDLAMLHKKFLDCLPVLPDAIVPSSIDAAGIKLTMESGFNGQAAETKLEMTDWFKMVQVVKNDGSVQLPTDWVPFLPNEQVISVTGQVPVMTCIQWFWTYISCGYYYCCSNPNYRRRKYTRSAIILTNKRMITMDLYERSGSIPATLSNFSVQVKSFILDKVSSGYIRSEGIRHLEAGIECTGGALCVQFAGTHRKAMAFAQAMQMSTVRHDAQIVFDGSKKPMEGEKSTDWSLIPLMGGTETVLDWIKGEQVWEDFGRTSRDGPVNSLRSLCSLCCCGQLCVCKPVDNLCSGASLDQTSFPCCSWDGQATPCCFFPCLPYLLTCAMRPFQTRKDIIITDMSIMRFARTQNFGLCGCLRFCGLMKTGYCTRNDSFLISWEPITAFSGFTVNIQTEGKENVIRRICACNECRSCSIGRYICPISHSTCDISLDFGGKYEFSVNRGVDASSSANRFWLKDPELGQNAKLLAEVQFALNSKAGLWDVGKDEKKAVGWF